MNTTMTPVTKDVFYAIIGPLENTDHGAFMHHHPHKVLRWRLRQWINGTYVEVAYTETLLDEPYPHPQNYYISQHLLDKQKL